MILIANPLYIRALEGLEGFQQKKYICVYILTYSDTSPTFIIFIKTNFV